MGLVIAAVDVGSKYTKYCLGETPGIVQIGVTGSFVQAAGGTCRAESGQRQRSDSGGHDSDDYRALVSNALRRMHSRDFDLLMVSTPIHECRRAVRDLREGFRPPGARGRQRIQVTRVRVVPQPHACAVEIVRDRSRSDPGRRVLAIVAGHDIVDWAFWQGGRIVSNMAGTVPTGVGNLLGAIAPAVAQCVGPHGLSLDRLDDALRCETTLIYGDAELDLGPYRPMLDALALAVIRQISARLAGMTPIHEVIVAGGGAPYFVGAIQAVFNASAVHCLPEPRFAVARGLLHIGKLLMLEMAQAAAKPAQTLWLMD